MPLLGFLRIKSSLQAQLVSLLIVGMDQLRQLDDLMGSLYSLPGSSDDPAGQDNLPSKNFN